MTDVWLFSYRIQFQQAALKDSWIFRRSRRILHIPLRLCRQPLPVPQPCLVFGRGEVLPHMAGRR